MLSALVDNHRAAHPFRRAILQTIIFTIGAGIWLAASVAWAPLITPAEGHAQTVVVTKTRHHTTMKAERVTADPKKPIPIKSVELPPLPGGGAEHPR